MSREFSNHQQPQYASPISHINHELRRKNVAASSRAVVAASAGTLSSHQDPWHDDPSDGQDTNNTCTCRRRRRSTWRSRPSRGLSELDEHATCRMCGRKRKLGFMWNADHSRSNLYGDNTKHWDETQQPKHADALLLSTPQLRLICPASLDMQGSAGHRRPMFPIVFKKLDNSHTAPSESSTPLDREYQQSMIQNAAHQAEAAALASLLWILAHEMSLEDFGTVETAVFTKLFALIHSPDRANRMAGLAGLDALLSAPSADEEGKTIKFANTLSTGLRTAHGDFEFLKAAARALGRMATRTANLDFVETEITRALEWLRTEGSARRLAACLSLTEFAMHLPTTFHSKTSHATLGQGGSNEFLDHIFQAIRDPQPIVRACAADALSQCLKILVERQHPSLTALLCLVYNNIKKGLQEDTSKKRPWQAIAAAEAAQHGSLLAVASMVAYTKDFMLPRFEATCELVLAFVDHPKALIRLAVVWLLPRLARFSPRFFGSRYLGAGLTFLMESSATPPGPRVGIDIRPSAFTALGQLILAMTDEATGEVIGGSSLSTLLIVKDPTSDGYIYEMDDGGVIYRKVSDMFELVKKGLQKSKNEEAAIVQASLHCGAMLVEALGDLASPYLSDLIDVMFNTGLSNDLFQCLQSVSECTPNLRKGIEDRMLQGVSRCLAGNENIADPLSSYKASVARAREHGRRSGQNRSTIQVVPSETSVSTASTPLTTMVEINKSVDSDSVRVLVLGLETLASFGDSVGKVATPEGMVPLLPFVQDVVSCYLSHPSKDVRRASASTCCALLVPHGMLPSGAVGPHSGAMIERVLRKLIQTAISDIDSMVRWSVVQALDSRYDTYLSQPHQLEDLFFLLQDEAPRIRAAGLRLLGRLASRNPGPILPVMRDLLNDVMVELRCGVDTGKVREEAARLLVVFLRVRPLQRILYPVLPTLLDALPLDKGAPPRLASASLEALGELADAVGQRLLPWVHEVIPHVLEIMEDRSSASKQRTSIRTLGQISGSTGYVIGPYLDYPELLSQAADMLPAAKRAPWSLRREIIRTLGIIGALDPDQYQKVSFKKRKEGVVSGSYFETIQEESPPDAPPTTAPTDPAPISGTDSKSKKSFEFTLDDNDEPAYLYMYEQYAMVAQPDSDVPPTKKMSPADDGFFPTVSIQALMRIFRDPSLAVHHGTVVQSIFFIFKSLRLECVGYLGMVVPHMLHTTRTCTPFNLRESLLMHLAILSSLVKEHLRPYLSEIFDLVEQFWSTRHLATIFELLSNLAVGSPDEFKEFIPRLLRLLLVTMDGMQMSDWVSPENGLFVGREQAEKLRLILRSICSLKDALGHHLHILLTSLLKIADSLATLPVAQGSDLQESLPLEVSVLAYRTMATLLESRAIISSGLSLSFFQDNKPISRLSGDGGLPARVVQAIVRILQDKPPSSPHVGSAMVEVLIVCISLTGVRKWEELYDPVVRDAITKWQATFPLAAGPDMGTASIRADARVVSCITLYDEAIEDYRQMRRRRTNSTTVAMNSLMRSGFRVGSVDFSNMDNNPGDMDQPLLFPAMQHQVSRATRQKIDQGKLQRAWDVSQRTSRDDWEEWMRRFSIQLLREAPSPALRATANLAHANPSLARELFSAAFANCWKELNEPFRASLLHALKTAFVADVSPEILQALLNLAAFMEQDPSGGLPIEIPILADLALKCRAYARALYYKEREFDRTLSAETLQSVISILGKLDHPEAALGVLTACGVGESDGDADANSAENDNLTDVYRHQTQDLHYSVMYSAGARLSLSAKTERLLMKDEQWLAKLGAWVEAQAVYEDKLRRDPGNLDAVVGCMQCQSANGEWQNVLDVANDSMLFDSGSSQGVTEGLDSKAYRKALRMSAKAAWRLGQWSEVERFSHQLMGDTDQSPTAAAGLTQRENTQSIVDYDASFFSAVIHIHHKEWSDAADAIEGARRAMDARLTALMSESYSRAYSSMVEAQALAEMEEIIEFRKTEERADLCLLHHPINRPNVKKARRDLLSVWNKRLLGCRDDVEVHSSLLTVRSLLEFEPHEEVDSVLTLSEISRQNQRFRFGEKLLLEQLGALGAELSGPTFGFRLPETLGLRLNFTGVPGASLPSIIDRLVSGDVESILPRFSEAHEQTSKALANRAGGIDRLMIQYRVYFALLQHSWDTDRKEEAMSRLEYLCDVLDMVTNCEAVEDNSLRVQCWLELGAWKLLGTLKKPGSSSLSRPLQADVLSCFRRAVMTEDCGYRAWHEWALLNFRIARQNDGSGETDDASSRRYLRNHIVAAVKGFSSAIGQGTKRFSASVQQDLLNLVTCLFKYGTIGDVAAVLNESIGTVAVEAWLGVVPQLLARIHVKEPAIRAVLHPLLTRLGEKHPQALMYPLSVLLNSPLAERKSAAESLMKTLKSHSRQLVEQALMVSSELIRVAISWLEIWHEGIEMASKYFVKQNAKALFGLLVPLHEQLEKGPETQSERQFLADFGPQLSAAYREINFAKEYFMSENPDPTQKDFAEIALNKAFDGYYAVFRTINKKIPRMKNLNLAQCSPALSRARRLQLSVPGSYRVDGSYINIESFVPHIDIIASKQKPRKITLLGSDGKNYTFLLKGHEELRQDDRVMQLIGVCNAIFAVHPQTRKHDFRIQRYSITPLSQNCGVVGWVPHSDTLHSLIQDYRQENKIATNMEHVEMTKISQDYEFLTIMQKVQVFVEALKNSTGHGNDLYEIMWLKSTNSEEWLERRTRYIRSLAVMSMVGYIIGLGDRHPSNLMIDRFSGRVQHIDLGDCFEISMHREKVPETVPFRLTRMLVRAMDISGIEGTYRSTCEKTMNVLRENRESLITMLEAFVYDPLISWKLADISEPEEEDELVSAPPPTSSASDRSLGASIGLPDEIEEATERETDGAADDTANEPASAPEESRGIDTIAEDEPHSGSDLPPPPRETIRAQSVQIGRSIQELAAESNQDERLNSIIGGRSNSLALSRTDLSMRQRAFMSLLGGADAAVHETALDQKAVKVIRRVEDKLSGTDFTDCEGEPIDVPEQVQRLIVQATSCENLCQLYIGWCSFW